MEITKERFTEAVKFHNSLSSPIDKLHKDFEDNLILTLDFLSKNDLFIIDFIEELLSYAKRDRELANKVIVDYLVENDQNYLQLNSGEKISLKSELSVIIIGEDDSEKEENKQKLYEWLASHGEGQSIKDILKFESGSLEQVVIDDLIGAGYVFTHDRSVHYQSLVKILKNRIEAENNRIETKFDYLFPDNHPNFNGDALPPSEIAEVKQFVRAIIKK